MLALRSLGPYRLNIPGNTSAPTAPEPSTTNLWDWYKSLETPAPPSAMHSAVTGLRHNAEGAAVGAILGFIDGEFGTLDIQGRYPIDGIAALLAYLMSVRDAGKPEGYAADLRAISQSCLTTYAYRKVKDWRAAAKDLPSSVDIPSNVDPILAAGKKAGL